MFKILSEVEEDQIRGGHLDPNQRPDICACEDCTDCSNAGTGTASSNSLMNAGHKAT